MNGNAEKQQYWAAQIEAWQTSGMTQAGWCAQQGLAYATFGYWRQRLRRAAQVPSAGAGLTLVPARLHTQALDSVLTLRSPAGWQCQLPATLEAAWLAALLRGLP